LITSMGGEACPSLVLVAHFIGSRSIDTGELGQISVKRAPQEVPVLACNTQGWTA
jgi:hypothetical protein